MLLISRHHQFSCVFHCTGCLPSFSYFIFKGRFKEVAAWEELLSPSRSPRGCGQGQPLSQLPLTANGFTSLHFSSGWNQISEQNFHLSHKTSGQFMEPPSLEHPQPTWMCPQLWVTLPGQGLDWMISRGAFQPQQLCDSVILWMSGQVSPVTNPWAKPPPHTARAILVPNLSTVPSQILILNKSTSSLSKIS